MLRVAAARRFIEQGSAAVVYADGDDPRLLSHRLPMIDLARLRLAYASARDDLLACRASGGHWVGRLSSSPLSTATAISALCLAARSRNGWEGDDASHVAAGLAWLAERQNADGGWGDTDRSRSNIATTMLVDAAVHLAEQAPAWAEPLARAARYVETQGGVPGLRRRYGRDKTFAVPILTNAALAGRAAWSEVSPLPFELACVPQRLYRWLQLPVVSYAIPALVAIGQARHFHRPPWNPVARLVRAMSRKRSLRVLERMQPASGGFLEATPLTSFVVMSLASIGQGAHPVTRRGIQFLRSSVRPDGSWPIDTNLATWNTTLAMNALAGAGEDLTRLDSLDWLLGCQCRERHPYTGAAPGGWGWSDLSGSVPDADDTPGALLALAAWRGVEADSQRRARILEAGLAGLRWLLGLQNRDGGWPTFCRGWGKLPFDRSSTDLTAHALRALHAWREVIAAGDLAGRAARAEQAGWAFLTREQRPEGSWAPLWFGNQWRREEENPLYGTSKVLCAYRDAGRAGDPAARRGAAWLLAQQNADGGWGGGPTGAQGTLESSVEETALAVESLFSLDPGSPPSAEAERGLAWLVKRVEQGGYRETSPIGFYFARLWYYEDLYPRVFTVSALGRALRVLERAAGRGGFADCPDSSGAGRESVLAHLPHLPNPATAP